VLEPVLRLAAAALLAALLLVALLYVLQRRLIYFPGPAPPASAAPREVELLQLRTDDGVRLAAWFLPAPNANGRAVLICNGNAGDRSHRLSLAIALAHAGYGVLLFDYRGYGGNPGSPTESGLRADARAAAAALGAHPAVDPRKIAYFGESLGAAVAGGLALERAPAALVLRSPPPSITLVGRHHYPYLPIFEPLLLDRFSLLEQIRSVDAPVLVLAAERDAVVPVSLSRRVFDAAAEPKRWLTLPATGHNDRALFDGPRMIAAVTAFLDEHLS